MGGVAEERRIYCITDEEDEGQRAESSHFIATNIEATLPLV